MKKFIGTILLSDSREPLTANIIYANDSHDAMKRLEAYSFNLYDGVYDDCAFDFELAELDQNDNPIPNQFEFTAY